MGRHYVPPSADEPSSDPRQAIHVTARLKGVSRASIRGWPLLFSPGLTTDEPASTPPMDRTTRPRDALQPHPSPHHGTPQRSAGFQLDESPPGLGEALCQTIWAGAFFLFGDFVLFRSFALFGDFVLFGVKAELATSFTGPRNTAPEREFLPA